MVNSSAHESLDVDAIDRWIDALLERHAAALTRPELLRAIRALSVRYVEDRARLPERSALDTAGKRAAFACYYTPLHVLTVRGILADLRAAGVREVFDLGCGTGAASIAWSLAAASTTRPRRTGVDVHPWALEELRWNCRWFDLRCTTRRGSLVAFVSAALRSRLDLPRTVWTAAWSINELLAADRDRLLPALLDLHTRGAGLLVIEPLSRRAIPWWDAWREALEPHGVRADEWKLPFRPPEPLAELDDAAGFRRDHLGARSLWLPPAG